ncbi:hypothetical protein LXL04_033312 [Taraxacum kok-saghyz]
MGGTIDPAQLDKILNKFRRSRTNEGTSDTATPVQVVDPLHPNARASMAEYLACNRAKYEMLNRMPLMEFELIEKSDWKDLDPGRRPAFKFRYLDDDNIVQLGSKVFDSLRGNVTSSTIPNLMLLAYNLKDHKGQRCFGKVPSELENPERLTEFDPIHADNSQSYNESTAIGFCYLAASYMSLFTISAEKYMKIQTRIHTKFISFYGFSFPFASFHLPIESMKALKSLPGWNHLLEKYSFYNFIYAGEMTPVGKNLKDFLYVMHTAYTGMHPYKLFCQIMEALNVTNTYLATIMYSEGTKRELNSLAVVFTNLMGNRHKDYKYQMWRFGRIIDPIFLSSLQTKNAKFFIAVCANILNMLSEESNGNILSSQIANVHEYMLEKAQPYAVRILENHLANMTKGKVHVSH